MSHLSYLFRLESRGILADRAPSSNISEISIQKVFDWIFIVCKRSKVNIKVYFITIELFRKYSLYSNISQEDFYKNLYACFLVAWSLIDGNRNRDKLSLFADPDHYLKEVKGGTTSDLFPIIRDIMDTLGLELILPTSYEFLRFILPNMNENSPEYGKIMYLLTIASLDPRLLDTPRSVIAATVIQIAIGKVYRYTYDQLAICCHKIITFHRSIKFRRDLLIILHSKSYFGLSNK